MNPNQKEIIDRLKHLEQQMERLRGAVEDLDVSGPDTDGDDDGHNPKVRADAQYAPGDTVDLVIEDDGQGTRHGDPMGRTPEGIVTFLVNPDTDMDAGDEVTAAVTKATGRHLRASVVDTDAD